MKFSIQTQELVYNELVRIRKNINYYRDLIPKLESNLIEKQQYTEFTETDIDELRFNLDDVKQWLAEHEQLEKDLYKDLVQMEQRN